MASDDSFKPYTMKQGGQNEQVRNSTADSKNHTRHSRADYPKSNNVKTMIEGYEKFRIPDDGKKHDWFIEVNYSDDEDVQGCKILKVTHPDKKVSYIKKEHLYAVLFAIGNAAEQREMTPQIVTTTRRYETVLQVKATKDIHKGESITFPVSFTLPVDKKEKIGAPPKKTHIIGTGTSI